MRNVTTILLFLSSMLACRASATQVPNPDPTVQPKIFVEGRPLDDLSITLEGIYKEYDHSAEAEGINSYLCAGGSVDRLQNQLTGIQTDSGEPIKAQVIEQDVTGDSIPDVIVSMALPALPGYGDTMLAVYSLQDGECVRYNLFGRTGAGSRGEGLYEAGGARVELVQDLNADELPEVLFYVASLGELYIASWNGSEFTSLVERTDELGNVQVFIPSGKGYFKVEDTNDDKILEIIITDPNAPTIWHWDGAHFQPSDE